MKSVALVVVAVAACGGDDDGARFAGGPSVGTACTNSPAATLSDVPDGDASLYMRAYADLRGERTGIWLIPSGGDFSLTTCMLQHTSVGPAAWKVTAEIQSIGTFSVEDGQVSALNVDEPVAGSITIAGYDADVGSVCGSMDLTMESGGRLRGMFSADVFCE